MTLGCHHQSGVRAGENVTKLTRLQGRVAAATIASAFISMILLGSWTAATAAGSFCGDSAQLQNWIAQDEQPGIDQYQFGGYPNPGVIQPEANYLQKLNAEAPQTIQPTFSVWANFAKAVADATATAIAEKAAAPPGLPSFPALASEIQPASAAATKVQQWFKNDSGCQQLYVATSAGGSGLNPLWWVAGVVVVLLIIGGIGSKRKSGRPTSPAWETVSTGRGRAAQSTYGSSPNAQTCSKCGGTGRMVCPDCRGSGRVSNGSEFAGTANAYRVCDLCGGACRIYPCDQCGGTGRE